MSDMCGITFETKQWNQDIRGKVAKLARLHCCLVAGPAAEPHSGLGRLWPLQIFFFPLDYGEKINGPPQHRTAGPPTHFSTILPAQVEG